ncbi:hypothetical protein BT96DRAFT_945658 [Gymnopus androsaceus JB14]|uniref:Hydrophobin n=1 Tax=Gymnopus androsaceus JB14 TaxID=1447944 RepID=A0A6A4H1J2_9AGAR|nr:hypothetical protein BT96DRAFT_945658 [Gymnopus androsaceus JB14]
MQFIVAFVFLALAALMTATSPARHQDSCSTPPIQCCNTVETTSSDTVQIILENFRIFGIPGDTKVCLECGPSSLSGPNCGSNQAVCCIDINYDPTIALYLL